MQQSTPTVTQGACISPVASVPAAPEAVATGNSTAQTVFGTGGMPFAPGALRTPGGYLIPVNNPAQSSVPAWPFPVIPSTGLLTRHVTPLWRAPMMLMATPPRAPTFTPLFFPQPCSQSPYPSQSNAFRVVDVPALPVSGESSSLQRAVRTFAPETGLLDEVPLGEELSHEELSDDQSDTETLYESGHEPESSSRMSEAIPVQAVTQEAVSLRPGSGLPSRLRGPELVKEALESFPGNRATAVQISLWITNNHPRALEFLTNKKRCINLNVKNALSRKKAFQKIRVKGQWVCDWKLRPGVALSENKKARPIRKRLVKKTSSGTSSKC